MGLKHEAKPGTVIEANGVKIVVLRGSPRLDITAPVGAEIVVARPRTAKTESKHRSRRLRRWLQ